MKKKFLVIMLAMLSFFQFSLLAETVDEAVAAYDQAVQDQTAAGTDEADVTVTGLTITGKVTEVTGDGPYNIVLENKISCPNATLASTITDPVKVGSTITIASGTGKVQPGGTPYYLYNDGEITDLQAPADDGQGTSDCDRHFQSAVKFIVDTPAVHFFSVSASQCDKPVIFSRGNLQYCAAKDEWRFALRQYDRVGNGVAGVTTVVYDSIDYSTPDPDTKSRYKEIPGIRANNLRISKNYDGWIDLFAWGTSGYGKRAKDPAALYFQPYDLNNETVDATNTYGYGPSYSAAGALLTPFYPWFDWGYYNHLREYSGCSHDANGVVLHVHDSTMYDKGIWRTLTSDEWNYMLTTREVESKKNAYTWVRIKYGSNASDTVTGILLYPDDFSFSEAGVASLPFGASNSVTELLATDWEALESAGCVFLPSTGIRGFATDGSPSFSSANVGQNAHYWSSSSTNAGTAHSAFFNISGKALNAKNNTNRFQGLPVRLVQDVGKPVEQRYYSAAITGTCDYVWDLGDKSLTVHRNKDGNEVFRDTLRSSLSGCDSIIRILSLTKKQPVRSYSHTITASQSSYTFDLGGGATRTIKFSSLSDGLTTSGYARKTLRDTLRDGDCDSAIVLLTLDRKPVRQYTLTTYATNDYTFTHGAFSKTWTLSDSSHLYGSTKTYSWLVGDTVGLVIKLTRSLAAFSVASGRKVGISPGNLNSTNQFVRKTTDNGALFAWASNYGNVAIKEGNSSSSYSANYWRMLTQAEWEYLLNTRSVSHRRYDWAVVGGRKGLILYPDSYTPGGAGVGNVSSGGTVSDANWLKMQQVGCVFLPAAGSSDGSPDGFGTYWSSTADGSNIAHRLAFWFNTRFGTSTVTKTVKMSVRLVRKL